MNRRVIVLLLVAAFLGIFRSGVAGAAQSIEERILFCSSVGETGQKLACFESIADSLREVVIEPPARRETQEVKKTDKKQQVAVVPAASQARGGDFGKISRKEREDELSASIVEVQYDGRGRVYVRLESGQIWRQLDTERVTISPGDKVVIKRGALGAYVMQPEGSNKRIKVRRQD